MPSHRRYDDLSLRVVFICTGNRARSALAEALFRKWSAGERVAVESYGTLDLGPVPALPHAIEVGNELGVDLTRHCGRPLREAALADADLVVGFEPFHLSAAVVEAGALAIRSFTLLELVSQLDELPVIAAGIGPRRARLVIELADLGRRNTARLSAVSTPDPFGQPRAVFEKLGRELDRLTATLVSALFGWEF